MGLLKDFKTFATKGNLADVAIAFVLGMAFNNVITSFTGGIVSPLIGKLTGVDFNKMTYVLEPSTEVTDAAGVVTGNPEIALLWGAFVMAVIDFIVIAFVCYMFIKAILKKDPNAAPDPTPDQTLLTEIRDLLKK